MMKRDYLYIAIGFVLVGMSACMDDAPSVKQPDEDASRIYLSAGIGEHVSSRAPYSPTDGNGNMLSVPTMSHPLNVSVWASTDNTGKFPHKVDEHGNVYDGSIGNEVAIHTTARFQSAEPQLLGDAIYPTPLENGTIVVNFIGLHPQSLNEASWEVSSDNQDASYTFTGKEDVMFAPMIYGEYGLDYELHPEKVPTFHFFHLLTWLRIKMVADRAETDVTEKEAVSMAWGKITSLTLVDQRNKVTIKNLGQVTKDNFSSHLDFSGTPVNMPLYQLGTDNLFPATDDYMIPTSETEVAYVMCAPVTGVYQDTFGELVPEYTLHIETEGRGEVNIPIDLKLDESAKEASYFTGSTMGKQFTILLNFKMGDVISVSTDISVGGDTDWFTHGTGTGDLTEDELD